MLLLTLPVPRHDIVGRQAEIFPRALGSNLLGLGAEFAQEVWSETSLAFCLLFTYKDHTVHVLQCTCTGQLAGLPRPQPTATGFETRVPPPATKARGGVWYGSQYFVSYHLMQIKDFKTFY